MATIDLGFAHLFAPAQQEGLPTLLLLHGTGGNEQSLLPIGRVIAPGAASLSPRGKVLENGMPRFFRRLAEGVFDQEDLRLRTHELARFVEESATSYGFDPARIVAVGYSNGANIAASLMLLHPGLLAGAALFRPMVPFEPATPPQLTGTRVFIAAGERDPIVPPAQSDRLAELLRTAGASVSLHWQQSDHSIGRQELALAGAWLQEPWL